jgi:tRNA pseudouridine55 synthase
MARRRKGTLVNGWIIIDKPSGKTSAQVVNFVRRLFNAQKAGHAGTLDPLATGVLPIAFGEATKTIPYVMDSIKDYQFDISWGEERDTDDSEGRVTAQSDLRPSEELIKKVLPSFIGHIDQVPPDYSAIKINGQRAYNLARNQQIVTLSPRKIFVKSFLLKKFINEDRATFTVTSGKGTYMRALARDLAISLGTVGHISALRRLKVGCFKEKNAISLDSLEVLAHSPQTFEHILPVEVALDGIPAISLSGDQATRMKNGQSISINEGMEWRCSVSLEEGDLLYAMSSGKPVAISRIREGFVSPIRVLNL